MRYLLKRIEKILLITFFALQAMLVQTQLIRIAATFMLFVLLSATFLPTSAQTIRRVTTGGTGDSSTWADAMNLEAALAASTTPGDQVWIAQGTYKPHATDRTVSFRIPTGVLVYGGFAGTEATFDPTTNDTRARNAEGVLTNVTILSGDLAGDDGTRPGRPPATADQTAYNAALATYTAARDDNSNTVVILAGENVTLDGLTISGGQGGNRADFSRGAGFSAGAGTAGATLTGCTFTGNEALSNGGGAFFSATGATLTNCIFTSNMSGNRGGGVYFRTGATLTACTFTNNMAGNRGGGAFFSATGGATSQLTNCTFTGNEASDAGGAELSGGGTLTACTFTGNTARFGNGGGAIFRKGGELRNCVFANNTSNSSGGGLSITSGATIINSTFYANTSAGFGGGMYYVAFGLQTSPFTLRNNVLIGNTATTLGNQVFVSNTGTANIVNIQTNLIEGGAAPSGTDQGVRYEIPGSSNITEENTVDDVDAVFASTDAMDVNYLRLTAGSPAVNLGNNDYLNNGTPSNPNDDITLDAAGAARIQEGTVDLGAYESYIEGAQTITFTSPAIGVVGTDIELVATASSGLDVTFEITGGTGTATLSNNTLSLTGVGKVEVTATQAGNENYTMTTQTQTITVAEVVIFRVTMTGAGDRDGSSWRNAMTLQAALAASTTPGDQVWIAQGTYKPHADDRTATFSVPAGVLVYGGFAGTEATFDPTTNDTRARNAEGVLTNVTILSGDLLGDDGTRPVRPPATADTADQTAYNAALATYNATRDDNSNTVVILAGENVTLDGLTISGGQGGNRADHNRGAGLSAGAAGATLTGCTFTGNEATSNGGGAFFDATGATLTNCTFTSNKSGNRGGGVFGKGVTLTACTFTNNIAGGGGGAYFSATGGATAQLTNCTFTGNEASEAGGAQLNGGGTLTACTFTGNTARIDNGGGAIFKKGGELRNCVFANNTSNSSGGGLSITSGATIINSTFYANTSAGFGGGMYVAFGLQTSPFTLRNNVLIGNTATASGNQVFVSNTDTANIVNIQTNLIEGGAAPSGTDQGVRYEIPGSSNITEENTVDEDDVDAVFASTDAMNENYLRLTAGSPAVNLGNNDYLNNGTPGNPNDDITLDAAGAARIQRGAVDLGAYESDIKGAQTITFTSPAIGVVGTDIELVATASSGLDVTFEITGGTGTATLSNNTLSLTGVGKVEVTATQVGNANYAMTTQTQTITVRPVVAVIFRVTMTGAGDRDGSSWRNAMTLQAVLAAPTVTGDQIWIAQGTYKPHADDRTATFSVPAGVLVYGGFVGTEATFDPTTNDTRARNAEGVLTNVTILSGDLAGDDGTRPVRPRLRLTRLTRRPTTLRLRPTMSPAMTTATRWSPSQART